MMYNTITSTKDKIFTTSSSVSDVAEYTNGEFGTIRTVTVNGESWFVGKDVCEILQYTNSRKAIIDHVDIEDKIDGVTIRDSIGREQKPICINESGIYALIFSSKMPKAKEFKHWVTSEVLPSIRKNGIYATENVIDEILNNPDFGIELLTRLKEERRARIEAERKNAILTHVSKTYTMTEIAKELNLKSANQLNKILSEKGIQFKQNGTWVFYSDYSDLGYESIKQEVLDNGRVIYYRRITQLGREFILSLFNEVA